MNYEIRFFNDNVYDETIKLPEGIVACLLRIFELAEIYGPNLGRPHSAPLGDGLFEFRAKGEEGIARSIFATLKGHKILSCTRLLRNQIKSPKRIWILPKSEPSK
ncbi:MULTISPECIES: type II toxin-antitoxin system RelE/ParE family toxin [unclassified Helicobacter]|uniref:type II toxin-antitoxin system RelE/ParE family toxin n=1 Tax=unclassified Helicobacter TaxID=2593540 RepID=UPI002163176C|nr:MULTISPECIES: type II toxin-antitoxin system RelE/ParE family toxin [unclassified Helicobacter]